jgi:PAS domain S-box-containing protein
MQIHFIFQDISEWKEAEATIKREHDRAEMYLNIAPVIIVALDLNGNVMLLNKKGQETIGYKEDEIIGKNWFDVAIPKWEEEYVRQAFEEIQFDDVESVKKLENRIAAKDGSEMLIDWYNSILRDESNNVIGTLSAGEDITQRRMADDLLKKQKDELSELAHVMSHDLGNKLKSINSLASLLKSEYDEELLDRISNIALQSIDLLQTSADLADAGAIIQTKERVNLEALVRNTAGTVLPDSVKLITSNLRIVAGSPQRIEQIFQNLFTNAIEHGNATEIRVEGRWEPTGYCIYVSNNGKTIPCDVRDRIFNRAFTTKQNGRGLGLAIVKKLVEAHGWSIMLYDCSKPTFQICTTPQT